VAGISDAGTRSENHPLVSHSPRDSLAIQIFKQWDRVLAADSRHVFEAGDINLGRHSFERGDLAAKIRERTVVKDEFV
jgi:hypothetical protein